MDSETPGRDLQISIDGDGAAAAFGSVAAGRNGIAIGGDVHIYDYDFSFQTNGLPNPYLGLRSFSYDERDQYAGREASVEYARVLLTQPGEQRTLLFITGVSGVGKSSFAMAGLIPAVERHYAARMFSTRYAVFRPSVQPIARLADALLELRLGMNSVFDLRSAIRTPEYFYNFVRSYTPRTQISMLVLDQFEELFSLHGVDPVQRQALFNILISLPSFSVFPMHIVLTFRSDFLPELFDFAALYNMAKQGIDLHAMDASELKRAIQHPIQALSRTDVRYSHKRWQPELVDRLAHDAAADATYLPLLQVTLERIWDKGSLTLDRYCGLTDAIKQRADAVFNYVDYTGPRAILRDRIERDSIMNIMLDLVDVSLDAAREDVRRRRTRIELEDHSRHRARLIHSLIEARLLSATVETRGDKQVEFVDIIHESLIRNWEELRKAIKASHNALQMRARFEQGKQEWIDGQQADAYLLEGIRLAEARELDRRRDIALRDPASRTLLDRSINAKAERQQRELAKARRHAITLSGLLLVAVLTATIAVLATISANAQQKIAQQERDQANQRATLALSRSLAAQAVAHIPDQYDLALLQGVTAQRLANTLEARSSLLQILQTNPRLIATLYTDGKNGSMFQSVYGQNNLTFSPDGKELAISGCKKIKIKTKPWPYTPACQQGTIQLWNLMNRTFISLPINKPLQQVHNLTFSADGRTLAASGCLNDAGRGVCQQGLVQLWELGKHPNYSYVPFANRDGAIISLKFSAKGQLLAVYDACQAIDSQGICRQAIVQAWDVMKDKPIGTQIEVNDGTVLGVTNGDTSRLLVAIDSKIGVQTWNLVTGRSVGLVAANIVDAMVNGSFGQIFSANFNRIGTVLAVGSRFGPGQPKAGPFGTIRLWNVKDGIFIVPPYASDTGFVNGLSFSPDNSLLAVASTLDNGSGNVQLRSVANGQLLLDQPVGDMGPVSEVAFSPNGETLASVSDDGIIRLWDVIHEERLARHYNFDVPIDSVAVNSSGVKIADSSCARYYPDHSCAAATIQLWNMQGQRRLEWSDTIQWSHPIKGHSMNGVDGMAFSHDGQRLAVIDANGLLYLWDVTRRRRIGVVRVGQLSMTYDLHFSSDNRTVTVIAADGTVHRWEIDSRRLIGGLSRLSLDAKKLPDQPQTIAISGDGKIVASFEPDFAQSSDDHNDKVILWYAQNGQHIGTLSFPPQTVNKIALSTDGKTLAVALSGASGYSAQVSSGPPLQVQLWDVATERPLGLPFEFAGGYVTRLAFSPDDRALSASVWDYNSQGTPNGGTIWYWDLDTRSWIQRACRIAGRELTSDEWKRYMNGVEPRAVCPSQG